jgi:hypothetical protein
MTSRRTPLGLGVVIGCVLLLALGPLVLTLLRAKDYRGSVTMSFNPAAREGVPLVKDSEILTVLQGHLKARRLQRQIANEVGSLPSAKQLPDYVTVSQASQDGSTTFVVKARGPTPEEARQLAAAFATDVAPLAGPAIRLVAFESLFHLRDTLKEGGMTPSERARIRGYKLALQRQGASIFAPEPTLGPLTDKRIGDRVLSALPGSTPARPSPVWAALAGIGLALAFGIWAVVLSGAWNPRPRPSA